MASSPFDPVLKHIRRLVGESNADELSDRELLERFAARHEEGVFEILLGRHASLVLGVCRRVLQHEQDAEDVFQATFLGAGAQCRFDPQPCLAVIRERGNGSPLRLAILGGLTPPRSPGFESVVLGWELRVGCSSQASLSR